MRFARSSSAKDDSVVRVQERPLNPSQRNEGVRLLSRVKALGTLSDHLNQFADWGRLARSEQVGKTHSVPHAFVQRTIFESMNDHFNKANEHRTPASHLLRRSLLSSTTHRPRPEGEVPHGGLRSTAAVEMSAVNRYNTRAGKRGNLSAILKVGRIFRIPKSAET